MDDNDLMEVRSDEDDEMSDDIDHVINNKPKVKKTNWSNKNIVWIYVQHVRCVKFC